MARSIQPHATLNVDLLSHKRGRFLFVILITSLFRDIRFPLKMFSQTKLTKPNKCGAFTGGRLTNSSWKTGTASPWSPLHAPLDAFIWFFGEAVPQVTWWMFPRGAVHWGTCGVQMPDARLKEVPAFLYWSYKIPSSAEMLGEVIACTLHEEC